MSDELLAPIKLITDAKPGESINIKKVVGELEDNFARTFKISTSNGFSKDYPRVEFSLTASAYRIDFYQTGIKCFVGSEINGIKSSYMLVPAVFFYDHMKANLSGEPLPILSAKNEVFLKNCSNCGASISNPNLRNCEY